jgi:hypothetical protein
MRARADAAAVKADAAKSTPKDPQQYIAGGAADVELRNRGTGERPSLP